MIQQQIITDFTQGELGPKMMGRFDLAQYYRGVKELTNFFPFFPGGVTLRPGFKYLGIAKTTLPVRLHPFIISQSLSYVLEFGVGYIRFWKNGSIVGGQNPIEVTTPWAASDLKNLQFAQYEAKLYIASGVAKVKVLEMTSQDSFTFGDLPITGLSGMVPFQNTGDYPRAIAIQDARLYLASTANEPQTIWASKPFDFGNFTYYETISNTSRQLREPINEFNGTTTSGSNIITGIAAAEISGFLVGDRITGPGIVDKGKVTFVGATVSGSNVISNVSSGVIAQLEAGETLSGQNIPVSTIISLGANSITINNNATGTSDINTLIRDERRSFIQSISPSFIEITQPATATQSNVKLTAGWHDPTVPEYHDVTTTRDVITSASAFKKEIASDQNEQILWLAAGRDLVVGTTTGERIIPSGVNSLSFICQKQTAFGSAPIQPFMLNDAVIFVEANYRGAREYIYTQAQEAYTSPSLTAFADHILLPKVKEIDYQNTPLSIAWFTLEDGTLAGCAYSRLYQLLAWFHVAHASGKITSLAVVPEESGDALYAVIKKDDEYFIEKMGQVFGTDGHLDSSGVFEKTNGGISGAYWLSGDVKAVYESKVYDIVIAAGEATLPDEIPDGEDVLIGEPFQGKLKTMPANAQARIGSAHMRPKTITKLIARILQCNSFKVGYENGVMEQAEIQGPATGDYTIPVAGTWDTEGSVLILQDQPLDTTILAISAEIDAGG